ncbi:MAG: M20 family metallopeptidase [Acidobacteria bacterium]|nr:M20 family metallopeptidase [Acidobacteriota bacterium]
MDLKATAKEKLDSMQARIIELSHTIHAHPEVGFKEAQASAWILEFLSGEGFHIETGICGLPTAFSAKSGNGSLHVAICAEYDALPEIGHACGHNIIAAAAVGAGIAAARIADKADLTVSVLGTPGEEAGNAGGKILMLERGAFSDVHAAMMVHPAPFDNLTPNIIAASMFEVCYTGREAHASAYPEQGINAADALTIAQTAIGLLRQHILPTDRIHGITTHGGDAPNIIPARTTAKYLVRGRTLAELEDLRPRVYKCFEAGALATGSTLEITGGDRPYAEMIHDADIAVSFRRNSDALGRAFPDVNLSTSGFAASTDMGNVSHAVPSIHPMIGIDSYPAVNHQREFTVKCIAEPADRAVCDGALAMAWTAIDCATDPGLRARLLSKK